MKCNFCGFDNRKGARFCLECGDKLEHCCPACGVTVPSAARYCDACGHRMPGEVEAARIDFNHPRSYTPKPMADKIAGLRHSIEGERKLVTVLFADLAHYTSICENLDPEEIHQMMDAYFKLLIDAVYAYEGIITQFAGDGIMALFGAPLAHEDHAQRACYAALRIRASFEEYAAAMRQKHHIELATRVGINSGTVIVGLVGDDLRMDYTALGDTINLASRLETMATPGSILVSRNTHGITKDFFRFTSLGKVKVRGKEAPLEAFELLEAGPVETRLGASLARGLTRFVGRERELLTLKNAFGKVVSGSGQLIGLVGEAGVGKSRLALELRNSLEGLPHAYLEGRCFHFGSSIAYLPILDILRSLFKVKEGEKEQRVKERIEDTIRELDWRIRYVIQPLYDLFSLEVEDAAYLKLEPKKRREKVFEAVRDLLIRKSQEQPLVLVIEDLHWIDRTSEEFLHYFTQWLNNTSVLLVLLYRLEYSHPWENKSCYTRIGLRQLPVLATNEMVEAILQSPELAPDLRELIVGRAGGNPLFVEELTYALAEAGNIRKEKGQLVLTETAWSTSIPVTLQGIVAARIDHLPEGLKRVIQIAAAIGKDFTFPILDAIAGDEEDLRPLLQELQTLEFVYEKPLSPVLEYMFRHVLVQEVAYNSLLLKKRKEIHGAIGNAMEMLYGERLEEFYPLIAYHYSRSRNGEKAYKFSRLSAIQAMENSALYEAFRFFKEAITLLKSQPPTEEKKKELIELYLLMGSPFVSLGFPEDSLEILQDGEKLARELGDTRSLLSLYSIMGLYFSVKGKPQLGLRYSEESLKIAEESQDIELLAPCAFDLCSNYASRGFHPKVAAVAPRVLNLLKETNREHESFDRGYNIYSALSAFYGFSTAYMGDFEKGKAIFDEGLRVAAEIGNIYSLGLGEVLYGYTYCHAGDGHAALEHFQRGAGYLEKGQIFILLGLAWSGIGWAHYFMGDLEVAQTFIERGLKIHSDAGIIYNLCVHYWFLANVLCDRGELVQARTYVDEAIRTARKLDEVYYIGLSYVTLGRILARTGTAEAAQAEDFMNRGIKILRDLKIEPQVGIGYLCMAEMYGLGGELPKAFRALQDAAAIFRDTGMTQWLAKCELAMAPFAGSPGQPPPA